ncbi:hypothetical protein OXA12_10540 [Acinetobacter baumannii]|uniref:hypothetical protein n=1 Tax=Acinetobacter baumannii TaxID=470 RepID=UPI00186920AF|nr:hypothetical protein [Acinetobacter baumannii]MCY2772887.1 hypothetical protein [Acinetobacter baumannii]MCY2775204.1 hypothetical protein [Acinetobacter baumannii]MCY2799529.1 hypothetical protein [Acinetobacter baumannii]MCY2807420.1 hypothetical protein [Acinetobacter baumannii]MCY2885985.1 hypothetical protein [Acinetobacter baumannii]
MKAAEFLKVHGLKLAKEVVEGAPNSATHYELTVDGSAYFKYENFDWFCIEGGEQIRTYMENHETCHLIPLNDLNRLVESVDLVESWGGIDDVKLYDLSHCKNRPESAGYKLLQAIADYESIYGGGDEAN